MAGCGPPPTMAFVSRPLTKAMRLSHLDAGTRFIVADSIRNLGQEDRAVVMPNRMIDAKPARTLDAGHRNPLTNDFT